MCSNNMRMRGKRCGVHGLRLGCHPLLWHLGESVLTCRVTFHLIDRIQLISSRYVLSNCAMWHTQMSKCLTSLKMKMILTGIKQKIHLPDFLMSSKESNIMIRLKDRCSHWAWQTCLEVYYYQLTFMDTLLLVIQRHVYV